MQGNNYSKEIESNRPVVPIFAAADIPRVALVDDNDNFRCAMAECLRAEGFHVSELATIDFNSIVDIAVRDGIEAMLIDVAGASFDGEPLIARLRRYGIDIPIAFISSKFDNLKEESALASGAMDFFVKHRGPTIVARRTWLLIDGARAASLQSDDAESTFRIGPLALQLDCHRAMWREHRVPLTVTEFKIVRLLACRCGKTFTYRQIYDQVHGRGFVAGDGPDGYRINVRALIKKIRQRFRAIDPEFDEIENVPGQGYKWHRHSESKPATYWPNSARPDGTSELKYVA